MLLVSNKVVSLKKKYKQLLNSNERTIRQFHKTAKKKSIESIFGLKFLASSKLVVCAHVALVSAKAAIFNPMNVYVFMGGCLIGVVVLRVVYDVSLFIISSDLVSMHQQISENPELVQALVLNYPELTPFNQHSAFLLSQCSSYKLTIEECELIIRFCIYSKTHLVLSVLLDYGNLNDHL